MKIKVLDKNFLDKHKDIPEVFDEYTQEYVTLLDENEIPYVYGEYCMDCNTFHAEEDLTYIADKSGYVCEDCLNDSTRYFYCDDCNYWHSTDTRSYTLPNGCTICRDCRYDHYVNCAGCGELIDTNNDTCYYCDECGESYCEDCWNNHYHENDGLYDYHDFDDWQLLKTQEEETPDFYIGHELEIDDGYPVSSAASLVYDSVPCICMHDGSLSDDGIEIISHPLSYNYMLSRENDYRKLFTTLTQDYNYKSHNTDTCGLHFHVTRPDDETIDRIILFMETYKEEIITLSRRASREIANWANFLSDKRTTTNDKELKSLDYIKKYKETSSRYMALNLTNRNTIEYRFFKGTLNYDTFMADFEFVYFLTKLARDHSIPVEELTWEKVVNNGRFLQKYIDEHNLHTTKPIVDYTTEILIEKNRQKEEIKKELYIIYKKVLSNIHEMTKIDNRKKASTMIDINDFNIRVQWLDCIIRDVKNVDRYIDDDMESFIKDIRHRITYIKERMN